MNAPAPSYQILQKLGENAIAERFVARDPTSRALVHLKVLHRELSSEPAIVARFEDEAALCQRLDHPLLVRYIASGRTPDGRLYLATEYLDGETLGSHLRTRGPLSVEALCRVVHPLCQALGHAHERGVIHRDLRPDKVLLVGGLEALNPRVIEFGHASFQGNKAARTADGVLATLPEYIPPECIDGQRADARSDIYSLGILMFEALTGRPPFSSKVVPEVLLKQLHEPPPPLPASAARVAPILERCLAKNPAGRFQTMADLEAALAPFVPRAAGAASASKEEGGHELGGAVAGKYELVKLLGKGTMGVVYLARHIRLGKHVAIKVLRPEHCRDRGLMERFFQEARTVNEINHEHIVEIHDFVEEPTRAYCVMEHLQGSNLATLLKAKPLPLARVASIAAQLCSAIGAAHRAGIVHRDIKPDNIFITRRTGFQDFVKVLDFGVAKLMRPIGESAPGQTLQGTIIGTPLYMAPEQASGAAIDHRADVYAVGVVLYEMLSGSPPFEPDVFGQLMVKIVTALPPPLPQVSASGERIPKAVRDLVMQCLAKRPDQRPRSMGELRRELERWMELDERGEPRARRSRVAGVRAVLELALVASLFAWTYLEPRSPWRPSLEPLRPVIAAARPFAARAQLALHSAMSGRGRTVAASAPAIVAPVVAEAPVVAASAVVALPAVAAAPEAVVASSGVVAPTADAVTRAPGSPPARETAPAPALQAPEAMRMATAPRPARAPEAVAAKPRSRQKKTALSALIENLRRMPDPASERATHGDSLPVPAGDIQVDTTVATTAEAATENPALPVDPVPTLAAPSVSAEPTPEIPPALGERPSEGPVSSAATE